MSKNAKFGKETQGILGVKSSSTSICVKFTIKHLVASWQEDM
jgi:hypothetical protein